MVLIYAKKIDYSLWLKNEKFLLKYTLVEQMITVQQSI